MAADSAARGARVEPGPGSVRLPGSVGPPCLSGVSSGLAPALLRTLSSFFFWLCCSAGWILVPQPGVEPRPLQENTAPPCASAAAPALPSAWPSCVPSPTCTESHRCPLKRQSLHFISKVMNGHFDGDLIQREQRGQGPLQPATVIYFLCFWTFLFFLHVWCSFILQFFVSFVYIISTFS